MKIKQCFLGLLLILYAFCPSNASEIQTITINNTTYYTAPPVLLSYEEGDGSTVIYDGNVVAGYNAYIAELKKNITDLNAQIAKKDLLLGEYVIYKAENVELQNNISILNSKIYTLQADLKISNDKVEEYRTIFEELAGAQSENSKEELKKSHNNYLSWVSRIFWSLVITILIIVGVVLYSNKADRKHRE